jgi:hypothetical protein
MSTILVATDRRALVIKTGAAATGAMFGRKCVSYGYGQISSIDMNAGIMNG